MAVSVAKASSAPMIIPTTESHYYSYSVREDGSANAWLRIDELQTTVNERIYSLELPKETSKEVKAWYRESNTCAYPMEGVVEGEPAVFEPELDYERIPCLGKYDEWKELKTEQKGNKLNIFIPKSKATTGQHDTISLGISFKVTNLTNKKWWGREIKIETPKFENYISYLSVGVDVPAGVYLRDKQSGPVNWGEIVSNKTMMSTEPGGIGYMNNQTFNPSMFDSAGGGQIIRDKSNVAPGENLSFTLMSATSVWKLYIKEVGFMIGGVLVLILVASILLKLIVGRKPIWWYLAVMLLIAILIIVTIWFVTLYKSLFYGYPIPITNF